MIAELAHGFELGRYPDGRPRTVVVDRLAPKQPGFIAREVAFLKGVTRKQIKATLPSPALLGERLWDAEESARRTRRREDFVRACVPILREELRLLVREGVSVVQIDDPHLCLFVDPDVRARYDDPDRAAGFAVDMTNEVVEGIGGVKLAVHLCRRAGARARGEARFQGGYGPILPHLNRLKVHHLTLEFTAPEAGDMAVFRDLREDFEIGLGCVGTEPGEGGHGGRDRRPGGGGAEAPGAGADHAQPGLRLRPGLGRGGEHRRGVPEVEERGRGRQAAAGAVRGPMTALGPLSYSPLAPGGLPRHTRGMRRYQTTFRVWGLLTAGLTAAQMVWEYQTTPRPRDSLLGYYLGWPRVPTR